MFNGYCNYATWLVSIWITNDYRYYSYFKRFLPDDLPEVIKQFIIDNIPIQSMGIYSDLMNAVISDIDFEEVAKAFIYE